jgi:hypothetical protein
VEGRPSVSSAFPDEYWKKVVRIMNKTQAQRRKKAKKVTFIENIPKLFECAHPWPQASR